ncbi:MAG: hypothetical protein ABEJ03_03525 [Candidatus Nanohaloarchaea archaeon]
MREVNGVNVPESWYVSGEYYVPDVEEEVQHHSEDVIHLGSMISDRVLPGGIDVKGFTPENGRPEIHDIRRLTGPTKVNFREEGSLNEILRSVKDNFRGYSDSNNVESVEETYAFFVYDAITNIEDDKEFAEQKLGEASWEDPLDLEQDFLEHDKGHCNTKAAAAAAILERLHREEIIDGTGTVVQASHIYGVEEGRPDSAMHRWAEYIDENGRRMVLDPTKEYFGRPTETDLQNYLPELNYDVEIFE